MYRVIYLVLYFCISIYANPLSVSLTQTEKKWMEEHPINRIAVMKHWPHNRNGDSLHTEILKLINYYSGLNLVPIKFESWNEGYSKAKSNDGIDGIMRLSWTKDREAFFYYSPPYDSTPAYLTTKKSNSTIHSLKDLKNKMVLVEKDNITDTILQEKVPSSKIISSNSLKEMYEKFYTSKNIDAMFSYFINEKLMKKYDFKIAGEVYDKYGEVGIGIHKSQKILSSIINKTFKVIPKSKLIDLRNRDWGEIEDETELLKKELQYLHRNNTIKVCIYNKLEPIAFIEDGEPKGMSIDVLNIIKEKLNIEYDFIKTSSWEESKELFENKKCDILPSVLQGAENLKNASFTQSYLSFELGIITTNDKPFVHNFDSLVSKSLSKNKNCGVVTQLKKEYPNLNFKETSSYLESLSSVINGDAYYTIFVLPAYSYHKSKYSLKNLQIAGYLDFKANISIAVQDDNKILLNILDKTLQTIPKSTLNIIRDKWSNTKIVKSTNWDLFCKVFGVVIVFIIVILLYNRKLKLVVQKKTNDINKQKEELVLLMDSLDKNVMHLKTDLDGKITFASKALCSVSGYTKDELIGKSPNIFRHPDMSKSFFRDMWRKLKQEESFKVEMKNRRKDGTFDWVISYLEPEYDSNNKLIGYSAIFRTITDQKALEDFNANLENIIKERTLELEIAKSEVENILENIMLPILITSKSRRTILYANKHAENLYGVATDKLIGLHIDTIYTSEYQKDFILEQLNKKDFINNLELQYKLPNGKELIGLLSVKPIRYQNEEAYIAVTSDISYQKKIENQIREVHKQITDSIEYASLIQHSLIPQNNIFKEYFQEYFAIWHPKDVVGGDIYLFEELNSKDECLLMVIDCTGHGVAGAFVTMLVKAIERQIISTLQQNKDKIVSPSEILSMFNKNMKNLLWYEHEFSISNAGFDAGILYYNKKESIMKFSGAEIPLFYTDNEGELHILKADRCSVGYKKGDLNFEYKEYTIPVTKGMNFYLSTDGYLDQNGGLKGFPFGKRRFINILNQYRSESFADQQEIFLEELALYQGEEERNDDITLVGFKI